MLTTRAQMEAQQESWADLLVYCELVDQIVLLLKVVR